MAFTDEPAPEAIDKNPDTAAKAIETDENQAIIITPAELKEALQPLADQVAEVAQQVAQLTEEPTPILASEPPVTIEAVEQKVTEQISAALEQHEAKKIEEAKTQPEKTELSQVVSNLAPLIKSNSNSYVLAFLTLICAAGMIISSDLYVAEKSANAQAISQIAEDAAKSAALDAEKIRDLAQDVVHIHLLKNENMELAIQKKMNALRKEDLPDFKAIPMSYVDPEVVKEVTYDLPDSVRKLPYAEELVLTELKRVASYAEKELSKKK